VADFESSLAALQQSAEEVAKLEVSRMVTLKIRDEKLTDLAKRSNVVVFGV
jgi:hypothetical protein